MYKQCCNSANILVYHKTVMFDWKNQYKLSICKKNVFTLNCLLYSRIILYVKQYYKM